MSTALTHAEDTQITASNGRIALEPNPRRIRAFFAGHAVADTTRSVYLFERGRLPMYYIPLADVVPNSSSRRRRPPIAHGKVTPPTGRSRSGIAGPRTPSGPTLNSSTVPWI